MISTLDIQSPDSRKRSAVLSLVQTAVDAEIPRLELAYIWVLWLGKIAQTDPYYRTRLHRPDRCDWSYFRYGFKSASYWILELSKNFRAKELTKCVRY
jgi:hypothetical protein